MRSNWRVVLCVLLAHATVIAARLPFQSLTTAEGLPGNAVREILRDSHGFLWFCTGDGLARYDGQKWAVFGVREGMPARPVWDVIETRSGEYWAATSDGLARLPTSSDPKVLAIRAGADKESRSTWAVRQAQNGEIWLGTSAGLFKLPVGSRKPVAVNTGPPPYSAGTPVVSTVEDSSGRFWISTLDGIAYARRDDNR